MLDDAFRSIDYRKASSFTGHMYTISADRCTVTELPWPRTPFLDS
jgi:hypothetical protein